MYICNLFPNKLETAGTTHTAMGLKQTLKEFGCHTTYKTSLNIGYNSHVCNCLLKDSISVRCQGLFQSV
jgi:hypothetical protein